MRMEHADLSFLRLDDGTYASTDVLQVVEDEERTDGESSEIEVIASTERMATDGDIIEVSTWRTGAFLRVLGKAGGPVLENHDPRHIIGTSRRVKIDRDARVLRAWYTHRGSDAPWAVEARRRREEGIRMPVSVRWIPGKVVRADKLPEDHPLYRDKPIKISRWGVEWDHMPSVHRHATLREISETPLPADAGALAVRALSRTVGVPTDAADFRGELRGVLVELLTSDDPDIRAALEPYLLRGLSVLQASEPEPTVHDRVWGTTRRTSTGA